jgi:hypothetical protein
MQVKNRALNTARLVDPIEQRAAPASVVAAAALDSMASFGGTLLRGHPLCVDR